MTFISRPLPSFHYCLIPIQYLASWPQDDINQVGPKRPPDSGLFILHVPACLWINLVYHNEAMRHWRHPLSSQAETLQTQLTTATRSALTDRLAASS
jgi:hypothetical protein